MGEIIQFPVNDEEIDVQLENASETIVLGVLADGTLGLSISCDSYESAIEILQEAIETVREMHNDATSH